MMPLGRLKFSGMIAPDDPLHQVQDSKDKIIAPHYFFCEHDGVKHWVPQYAKTVVGTNSGYDPAGDCDGYFMSYKFQPNNNCYAYGCNIASNSFPQPGRRHCYFIPGPPTGEQVRYGATRDGLNHVGPTWDDLKNYAAGASGGHGVALLISPADEKHGWPGDYHWVRCDDNASLDKWSQKDGNDQVTNFDFAGHHITDPAKANWSVNQGPINPSDPKSPDLVVSYKFFTFMWVPPSGVDII